MVLGSVLVILSGSKKTERIDATNAFQTEVESSEVIRRSPMLLKSPRLLKSPLIGNKEDGMEFVRCGRKARIGADEGAGQRVVWSSMK